MTENSHVTKHQISAVLSYFLLATEKWFPLKKKKILIDMGYWQKKIPSGGRSYYVKKIPHVPLV